MFIRTERLLLRPGWEEDAAPLAAAIGDEAILTKLAKASWKPASAAEAKAKELGYEVRRSKIEGSCYEVYGVKGGKLFELFYSPEDLSLKHTIAK